MDKSDLVLNNQQGFVWLVGWIDVIHGISNLVDYLIPNPLYTYTGCLKIDATH